MLISHWPAMPFDDSPFRKMVARRPANCALYKSTLLMCMKNISLECEKSPIASASNNKLPPICSAKFVAYQGQRKIATDFPFGSPFENLLLTKPILVTALSLTDRPTTYQPDIRYRACFSVILAQTSRIIYYVQEQVKISENLQN